uniref:Uncharacterized protein n=1 Tax=Anguilla anguilla TaxID=7936 RepID=A0A0E9WTT3_ANGAN
MQVCLLVQHILEITQAPEPNVNIHPVYLVNFDILLGHLYTNSLFTVFIDFHFKEK